jgi:hypothetical protein
VQSSGEKPTWKLHVVAIANIAIPEIRDYLADSFIHVLLFDPYKPTSGNDRQRIDSYLYS